jgi:hypothetical protein
MMSETQRETSTGFSVFLWVVICVAVLAVGLPAGLHAQEKGLYAANRSHFFHYYVAMINSSPWWTPRIAYTKGTWDGSWHQTASHNWDNITVVGSLGGCVFQELLYCFFTTSDGKLQYVTMDPGDTATYHGPYTILSGIPATYATGAAAAVLGDTIYVVTAWSTLYSGDGISFSSSGPPPPQAAAMVDAVTIIPPGDDPSAILVVYLDSSSHLTSCTFGSAFEFTSVSTLPYPYNEKFLCGNLVLGTADGYPQAGDKAACVQLYGIREASTTSGNWVNHPTRWEYNLSGDPPAWTPYDATGGSDDYEAVSGGATPWFDSMTGPEPDNRPVMGLTHVVTKSDIIGDSHHVGIPSDYMVAQNQDVTYGWDGTPTQTSTALSDSPNDVKLRGLWSLVAIILGPPPFYVNEGEAACATGEVPISKVEYGTEQSVGVTTTQTTKHKLSVSSETTIKAGFAEFSLDLSYAHAWTSTHGNTSDVSVSTDFTFSPCSWGEDKAGVHGWAIFSAPLLLTQWYKVYAYDYDLSTDTGTGLNQYIFATSVGSSTLQSAYFDLADPSDGNESIAGLFDGIPSYPDSTELSEWANYKWDPPQNNPHWTEIFGPYGEYQISHLSQGIDTTVQYAQGETTLDSHETSNTFSVEGSATFDVLNGFSEKLTVGYETEFSTETEIKNTVSTDVSCSSIMGGIDDCTNLDPDTVKGLNVQPYWLQAISDQAPWIPTGYGGTRPFCLTWKVLSYGTCDGATLGGALPPASASGTIRHGGECEKDTYSLTGGRLAWVDTEGIETPIPVSADSFDSWRGATVSLNGHLFSAKGTKGRWIRKGDLWKYKTREGVKRDPFVLELNFADDTWSFDASSKTLDQEIKTASGSVHVQLDVEGMYRFNQWLRHDVDTSWSHTEKKVRWQPYGVHEVEGTYNSQTGAGKLKLKGHIPKDHPQFGDLEIRINGAPLVIPLLSLDGFLDDLAHGRTIGYDDAEGLSFEVDFGRGRWKATVEGGQFTSDMAPDGGTMRVEVLLGGKRVSDQTFDLDKHRTDLTYGG